MPANYLEQLVSEWYEYQGYFVRRNVLVGKRKKGGYECELDVVAFHPEKKRLVQVEPSMDADSWAVRERRYRKKFEAGRKYIPGIFLGFALPDAFEQFALFVYAGGKRREVGGGKVMTIAEFLRPIFEEICSRAIGSRAVPEHMPILRTVQLVNECRGPMEDVWAANAR